MSSFDESDAFEGAAKVSLAAQAMAARPAPYLDDLNPAQRAAVEALDGPVLMLAGAGTGKTKALTTRIAHLLNTGKARPNEILAVTFTNKAAREMKDRVAQLLGQTVEGMPWLGTFHAIGVKLLRRHAELVGLKVELHHSGHRRSGAAAETADPGRQYRREALAARGCWPASSTTGRTAPGHPTRCPRPRPARSTSAGSSCMRSTRRA